MAIVEGFQIGITQQPFKMPYWAALLCLVKGPEGATVDTPWPNKLCEDIVKGFQTQLDKLHWRDIRLYMHFFAHLTTIGLITPASMLSHVLAFKAVLDEPGVSYERAAMAALCAGEALMRAGKILQDYDSSAVSNVLEALSAFADSTKHAATMSSPVALLHDANTPRGNIQVACLVSALRELQGEGFMYPATLLRPQDDLPELHGMEPSFELPGILVPPEVTHVEDETSTNAQVVHHRELPIVWIKLFDVEPSIDFSRAGGYLLRSTYEDIVDIYEINRKEGARILLDVARWFTRGTYRPRPGTAPTEEAAIGVQLELSVMETILSNMLVLPQPRHKPVYYHALITEICKLSPSTTGPAVGKSVRKLYAFLGEGLDVEIARRFSDWFAVHMSNFGYQWVWKEWVPDLALDESHPKRAFMRRALELEIRLSYYDRIMSTLPEPMQSSTAGVMPSEAPGYEFEYESSDNSHHAIADGLLSKLQNRPVMSEISVYIDTMRTELISSGLSDSRAASRTRSIAVQCLLVVGSRSFSHFLNAIEKYIKVLQGLSNTPDAKFEILEIVSSFWRRNRQMIMIIFDKLMQYQIVDPSDVVSWAFEGGGLGDKGDGLGTFQWELMRIALDKSNGRVAIAQRRVVQQRKLDEETRAARMATIAGNGMDVDDMPAKVDEVTDDSEELRKQIRAHSILVADQKAVLSRTMEGFVTVLSDTDSVLTEESWNNRASWSKKEWETFESWGWFRHFTRNYAPYLRVYKESLSIVYFSRVPADSAVGKLLRNIWANAVEQDQ